MKKSKQSTIDRSVAWNRNNKERRKLICERYVEKNKEKRLESIKKYLTNNPENRKSTVRKHYVANAKKICARTSQWAKDNRAKFYGYGADRRAKKLKATVPWINDFIVEEAYDLAKRRSKLKSGGHSVWEVDHIVPLKSKIVCGLHVHNNLQVIPKTLNRRKSNVYWPGMP